MKFKSPKEKWETGTVDDFKNKQYIIEFQDGNHGELHPKKNDFSNTGRYFITASQIDVKGILHLEKCRRLPEEFCQKLRIGFAEPNDVLFSHNATVGRVSIIPPSASSSIVGTSVTYYRLNPKMINQKFFFYLLRSRFIRNQYESKMKQTTRNQFSKLKQAKLNLIIPSLNEQKTLIKKLEKLFDEMNDYSPKLADLLIKYESQIKYINHIQSSVLDSAFSGKLLN